MKLASRIARKLDVRGISAMAVLLFGFFPLLGWATDTAALKSVLPGLPPMVPDNALGAVALGMGLLVLPARLEPEKVWRFGLAALSGAVPFVIGTLNLTEYATGSSFSLDDFLFGIHTGRLAAESAAAMACAGGAIVLLAFTGRTRGSPRRIVQGAHLLAAVPACFGYINVAGYLFGIKGLYNFGPFDAVSINTGIASFLAALSIFLTAADTGWRGYFKGRPMSLDLFQGLFPVALSLPLFLEAIVIWGVRLGIFQPLFGAALNALTAAISGAALMYIAVRYLRQAEGASLGAAQALAESEARFRGMFKHAATGIIITDTSGRFQSCNPACSAMLGYSEDELRKLNFSDLMGRENYQACMAGAERLLKREIPTFEILQKFLGKDGKPLWVQKHVSLLGDGAGRPAGIICLMTDMTERKQYEDKIRLLMREVNHRSKNILALVLSIARQTAKADPAEFVNRFEERIQALAESHDMLVKNDWKGVELDKLVRSQLAHFSGASGTRIEINGPPLLLCGEAAQAIGMALHELATNAGKYGALSSDTGRIKINWDVRHRTGREEQFAIVWRELHGPPVKEPERRGFGSEVLTFLAEHALEAEVKLRYRPGGLVWHLVCPTSSIKG
jgi:PAS domain S-box-containing protein